MCASTVPDIIHITVINIMQREKQIQEPSVSGMECEVPI